MLPESRLGSLSIESTLVRLSTGHRGRERVISNKLDYQFINISSIIVKHQIMLRMYNLFSQFENVTSANCFS